VGGGGPPVSGLAEARPGGGVRPARLVNAPGSGRSSAPRDESGYDLEAVVDFFEAWRQAVGLGPVTLMGHSWGGLVASAS
jgi:proline iminopeptidase